MKFPNKLAIGGDHAGFELKETIKIFLEDKNVEIHDFGTHGIDSVDYPDFAHAVGNAIDTGEIGFGILICGSANGISIAANKHQNVRAAIAWNVEVAQLARAHNNANVISLPARYIDEELAIQCITEFFKTDFEGGRHERRVNKIPNNC